MNKSTATAIIACCALLGCEVEQDLGSTGTSWGPVTPGVLCSGVTDLTSFKVDDRFVYCLSSECVAVVDKRVSTDMPDVERTFYCTNQMRPVGAAGDGHRVYVSGWNMFPEERGFIFSAVVGTDGTDLAPMYASGSEGDPMFFSETRDILVDGKRVYWATERGIFSAPKSQPASAGDFTLLADSDTIDRDVPPRRFGFAQDGDNLYWSEEGDLMMVSKNGGASVRLVSSPERINSIVAAGGYVYFTGCGVGRISRSTHEVEYIELGVGCFDGIAVDERHIYATSRTDMGNSDELMLGEIVRVGVHGGVPEVFAADEFCPTQLVVDDLAVYWRSLTADGDPVVRRAPK